jgi:small subunit ribosomal protein S15
MDAWAEHLLFLSADISIRPEMDALRRVNAEEMAAHHAATLTAGVRQANAMATLVGEWAGIAFENRRRVIAPFSEPGKPNHTGTTEVEGAYCLLFLLCVSSASLGEGVSLIL